MQNTVNDIMNYIPVTHDQAKLLKDLGYNKKTFWYWNDTKNIPYVTIGLKLGDKKYNHNSDKYNNISIYSAPRQDDPEVIRILTLYNTNQKKK